MLSAFAVSCQSTEGQCLDYCDARKSCVEAGSGSAVAGFLDLGCQNLCDQIALHPFDDCSDRWSDYFDCQAQDLCQDDEACGELEIEALICSNGWVRSE